MVYTSLGIMWAWLLPLIIWDAIWKGIALWKSGRNNHLTWFVCIFIFNTIGILPIIYLFFFQTKKKQAIIKSKAKRISRRKKRR